MIFGHNVSCVLCLLQNLQWNDTFLLQWPQHCHDNNNEYQPLWRELKYSTQSICGFRFTQIFSVSSVLYWRFSVKTFYWRKMNVWYLWTLSQLTDVLGSRGSLLLGGVLMCNKCFAWLNKLSKIELDLKNKSKTLHEERKRR